jgi:hypothetical protein
MLVAISLELNAQDNIIKGVRTIPTNPTSSDVVSFSSSSDAFSGDCTYELSVDSIISNFIYVSGKYDGNNKCWGKGANDTIHLGLFSEGSYIAIYQFIDESGHVPTETYICDFVVTESTDITNPTVAASKLYQNAPNPFTQNTQIKFYIPENVKQASLIIYNLQGKQLKQIPVQQRGESAQLISGKEFAAGIYLYALIIDGQKAGIKQMILTE